MMENERLEILNDWSTKTLDNKRNPKAEKEGVRPKYMGQ